MLLRFVIERHFGIFLFAANVVQHGPDFAEVDFGPVGLNSFCVVPIRPGSVAGDLGFDEKRHQFQQFHFQSQQSQFPLASFLFPSHQKFIHEAAVESVFLADVRLLFGVSGTVSCLYMTINSCDSNCLNARLVFLRRVKV